jgi:hypothetical protein
MPKQSKNKSKAKAKLKTKIEAQPETASFTMKKSYWIMLSLVTAVAVSIAGFMFDLSPLGIAVLLVPIVLSIGLVGYLRITPSSLVKTRRATFLFVGASFIGFGIWAAVILVLMYTGLLESIFVDTFFIIPSLITFLFIGAFIGELLGRNKRVEGFFFKEDTP